MTIIAETDIKQPKWIAKVGMILIKLTDRILIDSLDRSWNQSGDNREYCEQVVNIYREVEAILGKCPDVRNLSWLDNLRAEYFERFDHNNAADDDWFLPEASAFLYFELFLPKAERRYAFEVRYHDNVVEKVYIIYNGTLFLAFAEITAGTLGDFLFGAEIREFLTSRLVSDRWKGVVVPPCPLHPDIWVSASVDSKDYAVSTKENDDITAMLPQSEVEKPVDFFEYFLFDNSFSISRFLSVCTTQQRAWEIYQLIEDILASLTSIYDQLLTLPWYKFPKKLNLMQCSRQMAISLQIQCNELAKSCLALRREKKALDPQTGKRRYNTPFQPYFFEHLDEPDLSLSEVRETVKHMTDVVSQRYLQYYTVLAALAGGIAGAIITNIPFIYTILSKWLKG